MTVVDRIRERAAEDPGRAALVVDGGEGADRALSYADLVRRFEARGAGLRERGVAPGQRVGLVARQGAGFVEAALAVLAADACVVPIPDHTPGGALEEFAARARLHHLILEGEDFAPRARRGVAPVDGNGEADFRALRPAYLRFTSGTTSERKGVVLGHDAVEARLAAANRALALGPGDRVLWLLPMAHHFVVSILLYLRQGASVLLPASPLARGILEFCQRVPPTLLYASPHHFNLLAKDRTKLPLPDVRLALSTAEGLRADVAHRFRERFGIALGQALGIIEVGLPVVNLARATTKPESLGQPLPDYRVWLRGEDGRPVAGATSPERSGEICIRGPGLFDAYLDPWTPAHQILEPDGFRTGDQGWFDADGDLALVGRRANRINMAGMKFFSEEVESVLDRHPAVARSRVFARAHPHLGEIPVAEIVLEDPAREPRRGQLAAHCRAHLPPHKVPREFRVVAELPFTATGKLRRAV